MFGDSYEVRYPGGPAVNDGGEGEDYNTSRKCVEFRWFCWNVGTEGCSEESGIDPIDRQYHRHFSLFYMN